VAAFGGLTADRLKLLSDLSDYDLIFLYREAYPIGPALLERWLAAPGKPPIVYDFDDAVFLPNVSDANRFMVSLKWVRKIPGILRLCTHVVAGNEYLAAFAKQYNPAVTSIPTCVDTDKFRPRPADSGLPAGQPIVGWIGSPTTAPYLATLRDVFRRVHARRPFELKVSGASADISFDGVPTRNVRWSLGDEVTLFNTCDIGVYPLTDDEWSKGKCGFKAIEFMACGVPVVASAVGVNREIVQDGANGFLAATEDEWVDKLGRLLADSDLRCRFAAAWRQQLA